MSNIAYLLGKSFGRRPKIWAAGAGCLVLALFVNAKINDAKEDSRIAAQIIQDQREAEQAVAARSKAHDALVSRCTIGIGDAVIAARTAIKSGDPAQALALLKPCDGLMIDASAKLLYAQAGTAEKLRVEKSEAQILRQQKAKKKAEGVNIGMSQQDALDSSWGRPEKVNRTTNASGVREQWVYGSGSYLYFTDGILSSIQN